MPASGLALAVARWMAKTLSSPVVVSSGSGIRTAGSRFWTAPCTKPPHEVAPFGAKSEPIASGPAITSGDQASGAPETVYLAPFARAAASQTLLDGTHTSGCGLAASTEPGSTAWTATSEQR